MCSYKQPCVSTVCCFNMAVLNRNVFLESNEARSGVYNDDSLYSLPSQKSIIQLSNDSMGIWEGNVRIYPALHIILCMLTKTSFSFIS